MIIAIMMIAAVGAQAQRPEVGKFVMRPMAGVTFSSFGASIKQAGVKVLDSKYKVGFTAGLEGGYQFNEWFQPSVGVFYSQQGSKCEEFGIGKYNTNMDYLTVPVLGNFYVYDGLALKAGVQPGILLSAKADGADVKDDAKSFQLQIPIGISYEYQNFVIDARMFIPVTKAFKSDVVDDFMNNTFAVTVGYNFQL